MVGGSGHTGRIGGSCAVGGVTFLEKAARGGSIVGLRDGGAAVNRARGLIELATRETRGPGNCPTGGSCATSCGGIFATTVTMGGSVVTGTGRRAGCARGGSGV